MTSSLHFIIIEEQCSHKKFTKEDENIIVKYSSAKYDIFEESNEIEFVPSSTQCKY
jgi:hypothetical protein